MNTLVTIPYNLTQGDLVLDPTSKGTDGDDAMDWINDHVPWNSDELIRIMTATVCLHEAKAGTFGECLDTATIWERG